MQFKPTPRFLPRAASLLAPALAAVLALAAAPGCRSPDPQELPGKNHGAIVVSNATPAQIHASVERVFRAEGFTVLESRPMHLVMEKPSSTMNTIIYGGWFDRSVWVRVKIDTRSWVNRTFLTECHAVMVRDHGRDVFEDETTRYRLTRKPFQDLMDRALLDLQSPAAATPSGFQ